MAAAGDRLGRLGFPGQLEGPRADQPGLPVARREQRRRPVLRQLAGRDQVRAPLVGLAPQELGGLGDVAGLVEHEQRFRREVIERGRRREQRCPDLRRVADGSGARFGRLRRERVGVGRPREPLHVLGEALGEPLRHRAKARAQALRAALGHEELRGRQEHHALDLAGRALVGRVERPERVDLVAEELDPDRQLGRRREDVDDAAAPGELAPPRDLEHRRVAELEQLAEQRALPDAGPDPQLPRLGGEVGRRDRVLEERLDARHEDPGPAAPPRGERRDPGGRLVGDQLAPLVGERRPRLEDGHGRRVADPRRQLLGDAIADLGVRGDPADPLAADEREGRREVALRAVRHRREPGVAPGIRARAPPTRPEPFAERREGAAEPRRSGGKPARSGRRRAGSGAWLGAPASWAMPRAPLRPSRGRTAFVGARGGRRGARRAGARQPFGVRGAACGGRSSAGPLRRSASVFDRIFRQPVFVRRIPSGPGGPSTSPGGATRSSSAGRSSNGLNRFAALFVPSRAHASTASAAASSSSSSRCRSSGANCVRTWSMNRPRPARRSRRAAG